MKIKNIILFGLLSIPYTNIFAGDLVLSCFTNQDPGSYLGRLEHFENNKATLKFEWIDKEIPDFVIFYKVFVERKSLFFDYTYIITQTNSLNSDKIVKLVKTIRYNDIIDINKNIQCYVND